MLQLLLIGARSFHGGHAARLRRLHRHGRAKGPTRARPLIESLNNIKEETDENVEQPTQHSLELENKVITFAEAFFENKIGEEEEEAQYHYDYATITNFKCSHNSNHHVVQSMSPQLQDESHSPLLALPFPAMTHLTNTSTSSNTRCMSRFTFECFGRQYLTSVGPRGNALAVDRMTQNKLWKGSLPVIMHMHSSQYG